MQYVAGRLCASGHEVPQSAISGHEPASQAGAEALQVSVAAAVTLEGPKRRQRKNASRSAGLRWQTWIVGVIASRPGSNKIALSRFERPDRTLMQSVSTLAQPLRVMRR